MKIPRLQTAEMLVKQNFSGNQINFPDIPLLRSDSEKDALIMGIRIFTFENLPATPANNLVATLADCQNAFLTLYCLGQLQLNKVPLTKFLTTANNADTYFWEADPDEMDLLRVDWQDSYVNFASPPNPDAAFSFFFEFQYGWFPVGAYAAYLKNQNAAWASGNIR